jgi:hypothetical protein
MATVKPTSKKFTGAYNQAYWATKETAIFRAQYLPKVYHVYGDLVRLSNIKQIAGQVMQVPNATISHFEKYSPNFAITLLEAISTGSAGADISFKIETTDYDSNNQPPLRLYESIEIPRTYQGSGVNESRLYRIHTISGSGTDLTFTASPFNKTGTYDTASQITTEVPAGTTIRIAHTSFAVGMGQPNPKNDSWATREHVAAILAESKHYEGGQMAQAFEEAILVDMKNGSKGVLMSPIMEVGEDLDRQIESYIVTGERTNTDAAGMTETSYFEGDNYVKSGFGFMKWANILAQEAYHTGDLSISDLDRRKLLLLSQGIAAKKVLVLCGPEYYTKFENAGLDYVQQYSSSDLLDAAKNLGVEFKSFMKGQIQYTPIQLDCFADPSTFGINVGDSYSYEWPALGLYIPEIGNTIRMNGKNIPSIPNIMLGYVNKNGEDRTRMVGIEAGPNSVFPGNFVANQYDGFKVHVKTHIMVICVNVNQWILDRQAL